jgi:hypothetical protein
MVANFQRKSHRPPPVGIEKMSEPISPEDRGGHFAAKAECDSTPALSRIGAGERIHGAERPHIERMLAHALEWISENVKSESQ